jgi:NDP-sugar pyrophosphorylase family protein
MEDALNIKSLLDISKTLAQPLLQQDLYPWEVLPQISEFILSLGQTLPNDKYISLNDCVWVAKTAKISGFATINGPAIIGEFTEVRPSAFIRGNVMVGQNCVVGNSTELKNCILFDGVQVPHYNYVGDSILGYRSHMGAGAIISNVKGDKKEVFVHLKNSENPQKSGGLEGLKSINTGLKKFGAILGDFSEIGCNSVLNPGTIIGRNSTVYPLSSVRGVVLPDHIYKNPKSIVPKL